MGDDTDTTWSRLLRHAVAMDAHQGCDWAAEAWIALREEFAGRDMPYLVATIRNLRRAHARRDARRIRREQDWSSASAQVNLAPLDEVVHAERLRALEAALEQLAPHERRMLLARYVEGETSKHIAARSDETASTIRWRLKALIDRLRLRLTEFREESMRPDREVLAIVREIESRLDDLPDEWSGRIVLHLLPSRATTRIDQLELVPPAPRGMHLRLRRRLCAAPLPGCTLTRPFEMHFECTPESSDDSADPG